MSVTCPSCGAADEVVAVHKALLNDDRPLDPQTRDLLSLPTEPGRTTGGAIVLFVLAGVFGLLGLSGLLAGDAGGGHRSGALVIAVILLGIGLAFHADHRSRRSDAADQWPQTSEQWLQLERVWRETWFCRHCQVAFLPTASQAIPVAQFPQWTAAVARQDDRPGA
ncbi:hypothetical protein [Kitasatospora sp. NPDC101183]|uniref:hypothetical protein n=1 Tax=Kitasatospora sp. NPDC101183 TaxID=3364100 RepID=UPI0037F99067